MIKAVIFDYGGVLISGGGGNEPAESLAAFLECSVEEAAAIISAVWVNYISGKLSESEYWAEVEKLHGEPITKDINETRSSWENVAPLSEMINFIKQLKAKNYTVGLLSNITASTEATIRAGGGYDLFDPCVLSCKVGCAKPGPEIYHELLKQLPSILPEEIVFIDDQQRYLDTAQTLGIQTVLAINTSQIIKDVTNLLQT